MSSRKMRNLGGGPPQPQPQRRLFRKRTANIETETRFDVDTIGAFKMTPSFQPEHFMTNRPLMGACCSCMPRSQKDFMNGGLREMGMRNILDVRTEMLKSGILARYFGTEIYAFNRPLFKPYSNISRSVLTSPRVLSAIEETARQITKGDIDAFPKQVALLEKKCSATMTRMKASVSSVFLKITAWFLTKYLAKFLRSVQVCRGQMRMVKEASERKAPMIYLPLHRSHLDYILVTLILWHYDIRAPFVAAGDNMNIPFFNLLMRWLGGFFIRRRLDSDRNKKDIIYRALLHEYMTKLLSQGEGLEFFIEGGRTRTGKSMIPKGGLLSVVVEAFNEGEIPDAYIVPVTFSYEKIIDGNYCREQMGLPKVKETFMGAVKAIFRVFFNTYGSVRVDFAQPFSLREFMVHAKAYPYHPITLPTPPGRHSLDYGASYPNFSSTLLSVNGEAEKTRMLVKALADHVVYTSDHCTAPMATHLISFLLLTKYRKGVYLRELTKSVHWIIRELQALRADVGFCGQSEDVILYAQELLGSHLISKKWYIDNHYS
ncbi:glycerol-3-phosphate acyltransferase 1, mitochondrial [Plakobranchus ocellatus]|uniref:Glycerol-3-phosphate acyltransferase 1, mitochondrial n=1 Tax=Plakobranchus ocellatus TaxID=259542 RepID=A0AAV4BYH9_9GAST|nr:glycerol-3-phosphate acyltransferase 1, mitochondrial [Plakobranchus ocellatus]